MAMDTTLSTTFNTTEIPNMVSEAMQRSLQHILFLVKKATQWRMLLQRKKGVPLEHQSYQNSQNQANVQMKTLGWLWVWVWVWVDFGFELTLG